MTTPSPAPAAGVAAVKSDLPSRAANLSFTSAERELLRLVKTAEETSLDPANADTSLIAAAAARGPGPSRLPGLSTSRGPDSKLPAEAFHGSLVTPRFVDVSPQDRIFDLFLRTSPQFVHLCEEKKKGWSNQRLDVSFQRMAQNKAALSSDPLQSQMVVKMMRVIQELDEWKNRRIATKNVELFLDLGAAPGGFARYILEHRPSARGIGITLPPSSGGMNTDALSSLPRYSVHQYDVASLRCKFLNIDDGYVYMPHEIVENAGSFDLVICDAQFSPLPGTAPLSQEEVAINVKILLVRELLLMYKVLKVGGNAIVKLSMKEQVFYSCLVAQLTTMFGTVDLVKPRSAYQLRSTFFALCTGYKDVPAEVDLLADLLRRLREKAPGAFGGAATLYEPADLIARFGDLLKKKYEPIWKLQANNLARTTAAPDGGSSAAAAADTTVAKSVDDVRARPAVPALNAAALTQDDDFVVVGRKGNARRAPHSNDVSPRPPQP